MALNSAINATADSNIELYLKIAEPITISGSQRTSSLKVPQSAWHANECHRG
jgi:hypothetical protein